MDQSMFNAKFICFVDLEGKQKKSGSNLVDEKMEKGLSFGNLSNLRQIETRKRLFETKLKVMDNEVVKFTCIATQIPSYFKPLDKLDQIEKAAKDLKPLQQTSSPDPKSEN